MTRIPASAAPPESWLLLIFQLPAQPAYLRVKIWRRLQEVGAITVKNAVYILPAGTDALEDLQWLLREIEAGGGDGMVCESRMVEGLSDTQLRELFDKARDADYEALTKELQLLGKVKSNSDNRGQLRTQLGRLRKRFGEITDIDFFGADARDVAANMLARLEAQLMNPDGAANRVPVARTAAKIGRGHTWVTRKGVKVDRIASAWLIARFIDPDLKLKFVTGKTYVRQKNELRFDMFDAEYTHEGDRCTFEVLLKRTGLRDAALVPLAEIVHDIDIKDGKYGREETGGIRTLITSICMLTESDEERIKRGSVVFENLYAYFKDTK